MNILELPFDALTCILKSPDRLSNDVRLVCSSFNDAYISRMQNKTVLIRNIEECQTDFLSMLLSVQIRENINNNDLLTFSNCRSLILDRYHRLTSNIFENFNNFNNLRTLVLKYRLKDISILSNFYFDKLEIIVKYVFELKYIRAKNLILSRKRPKLTANRFDFLINQDHIDNIGCNSLIISGGCGITGNININKLQFRTRHSYNMGLIKSKHLTIAHYDVSETSPSLDLDIDFCSLEQFSYRELFIGARNVWLIESLDRLQSLSKLILRGCKVTGNLKYFSKIQNVSLIICNFEEEELLHLKDCEYLDLSLTNIEGININQLNCKSLNLSSCINIDTDYFCEKEFEYLNLEIERRQHHRLSTMPKSRNLNLRGRLEIKDNHLENLSSTRKIDLRGCDINGYGLHDLENCKTLYVTYKDGIESFINVLDFEEVYICLKLVYVENNERLNGSGWEAIDNCMDLFDTRGIYINFCCNDKRNDNTSVCMNCIESF